MHAVLVLVFLFFFTYGSTQICERVCHLDDESCVTRGGKATFSKVVHGVSGLVPSLDPLHIDRIQVNIGEHIYAITNVRIRGIRQCEVTRLLTKSFENNYKQHVHCPKMISTFDFKGIPGLVMSGSATLTATNCSVINSADYGVSIRGSDYQPHFYIKLKTHQTSVADSGELKLNIERADGEDSTLSRNLIKTLQHHIASIAMESVIRAIDVYTRNNSLGAIIPYL